MQVVAGTSRNQLEPIGNQSARQGGSGESFPVGELAGNQPSPGTARLTSPQTHVLTPAGEDVRQGYVRSVGGELPHDEPRVATKLVRDLVDALHDNRPAFARIEVVGYCGPFMRQALEQVRTRCEQAHIPVTLWLPEWMEADYSTRLGWCAPRWTVRSV